MLMEVDEFCANVEEDLSGMNDNLASITGGRCQHR